VSKLSDNKQIANPDFTRFLTIGKIFLKNFKKRLHYFFVNAKIRLLAEANRSDCQRIIGWPK